jgi:hypothetical protein
MGKTFTCGWTWYPVGILNENYGFRVIYNAQSNLDARLSTVLINGNRVWKPTVSL